MSSWVSKHERGRFAPHTVVSHNDVVFHRCPVFQHNLGWAVVFPVFLDPLLKMYLHTDALPILDVVLRGAY